MSDTVSDLASRAQAREEVAKAMAAAYWAEHSEAWDSQSEGYRYEWLVTADTFIADFPRLASLLGYVKVDGEDGELVDVCVTESELATLAQMLWQVQPVTRDNCSAIVHRLLRAMNIKVVTDAEQE